MNYIKYTAFTAILFLILSCENQAKPLQDQEENLPAFDGTLKIGEATGKTVTSFLTGVNTVYSHEDMTTWEDGNKLRSLKSAGISALRYPEGHQVSFWDWEFPYHEPYQDIWKPAYEATLNQSKLDELKEKNKDRMVLDDYFEICREGNIEPVVGINMFQGWKYDRTEESIQKAVRLVEHCLTQNPKVTYFFLDNEAGHQPEQNNHIPIDDYINLIPAYSKAIKAVHPDAMLIPNIMQWGKVEKMIRETGQHWDVYDQHWYYNSGKWAHFDIEKWRREVESTQYANRLKDFRKWKEQYGMDHLKFSFLEWNGPPPGLTPDSSPPKLDYTLLGLIQADQLMFFAKNGVHMATAWPLMWQTPTQDVDLDEYNRNLLDRDDSNWLSPSATIFQAFSYVQNGEILQTNNDVSTGLRVLTVKRDQGKGYAVLILNKSKSDQTVEVVLPNEINKVLDGQHFTAGSGPHDVRIETLTPKLIEGKIYLTIEDTSFAYLLFE